MSLPDLTYSSVLGRRAETVFSWLLRSLHLPGDVAECGIFRGETSREIVRYIEGTGIRKTVHMFDTFEGLPDTVTAEELATAAGHLLRKGQFACALEAVVDEMGPFSQYMTHKGLFSVTFQGFAGTLCFIHADADLYSSTIDIIRLADKCLVVGGTVVFDDYDNPETPGVRLAIERYLTPERYIITPSSSTMQCVATRC